MSADHDRTFVRTFLLVLGVLVAITIAIIIAARMVMSVSTGDDLLPRQLARIEQRTQPVFEVVTDPSQIQTAQAGAGTDDGDAESAAEPKSGQEVYASVCAACHQAGVAGAPKTSDAQAWQSRLSEGGRQGLYDNAINGLNAMPAKGGDPSLSDQEVKNAVDHILKQAGI